MKSWNRTNTVAKWALTAATIATLSSCGSQNANTGSLNGQDLVAQNIIGGSNSSADFQKQNGIVGLLMVVETKDGQQGSSICTGSLIASNVVVTAAHCLVIEPDHQLVAALVFFDTDLDVVMEKISKGDYSTVRPINKIARHKEYGRGTTAANDIGLLRFEGTAPAGFKTARLAPATTTGSLKKGSTVTLAGFGVSKYDMNSDTGFISSEGSGLLRQVAGIEFLGFSPSAEEMVFDQTKGKGACHGDSGGPAYVVDQAGQAQLIGVTSRGTEQNGLCNKQAIYTSVMAFSKWIADNLTTISQDEPVQAAPETPAVVAANP